MSVGLREEQRVLYGVALTLIQHKKRISQQKKLLKCNGATGIMSYILPGRDFAAQTPSCGFIPSVDFTVARRPLHRLPLGIDMDLLSAVSRDGPVRVDSVLPVFNSLGRLVQDSG